MKRILCACEESQAVCIEFRKLGYFSFSCDLQPCSGGHPEWHIQEDVFAVIDQGGWDCMIAFPPCTDLTVSGAKWFSQKIKDGRQQKSITFFLKLCHAPIERIAIENPIGIMSKLYRPPDQIIQPWHFGHGESKSTCLWLKNLPTLKATNMLYGKANREQKICKISPSPDRVKIRSKTYPGIAQQMAIQWAKAIEDNYHDPKGLIY
jgi:site-specific DNA-cytosine methylase